MASSASLPPAGAWNVASSQTRWNAGDRGDRSASAEVLDRPRLDRAQVAVDPERDVGAAFEQQQLGRGHLLPHVDRVRGRNLSVAVAMNQQAGGRDRFEAEL